MYFRHKIMWQFGFYTVILIHFALQIDGCGRKRRANRDATPPVMSCPGDRTEVADKIQVHTKVTWEEPIAMDNENGKIIPRRTGLGPGWLFSEGSTQITYTAKDRWGNYRSCDFYITVTVTRCKFFDDLTDGWKACHPSHDMRRGGTCQFGCYEGHELQGQSSVTCQDSGLWTDEMQPFCKKTSCPRELPADHQTIIECTNDNFFRSICTFTCEAGYDILPGLSRVKVCSAHGYWNGPTPVCVDIKPPQFEKCPSVIKAYAERSRTAARVRWDEPVVTDNSGSVSLVQISGPRSGDEQEVGQYSVTYIAYDDVNNTAECSFIVVVKQILCPTIHPLPYTTVVCPSGRRYGSTCVFSCDNSTAINGQSETQCTRKGAVHYYGEWTFGDHQPYCTLTTICPELRPPDRGALACDVWMDGRYCQTFCREGYLFNTQEGYEFHRSLLVCGDSGKWYPEVEKIPDCVPESRMSKALFKIDAVFYFDGPCKLALNEIKEKFLFLFGSARGCEYPEKCIIENVEVTCGNDTDHKRKKRSSLQEIFLSAVIAVKPSSNEEVTEILKQRENIKISLKHMNETDSRITYESAKIPGPELVCPDGYEPEYQQYKCAECSRGYYHDSQSKTCIKCPYGQYQPDSKRTSCITCPNGTTTVKKGAFEESQCLDACDFGYFSLTGVEPCSPCDIGYYSDNFGARECTPCPGARITRIGAKTIDDCYDFDLEFREEVTDPAVLAVPVNYSADTFTIAFWVQCALCHNILAITDQSDDIMSVKEQENFSVTVKGQEFRSVNILSTDSLWKYIRITLDSSLVSVTVNGEISLQEVILNPPQHDNYSVFKVTAGGSGFIGSIYRINVWDDSIPDNNGANPKCLSEETGNLVNWKLFADTDGDFVQTYSKCDDFDNCLLEPCKNGALCTDGLDGYSCLCLTGYTGTSCENNIDYCLDHVCANGATCLDDVAGYNCLCPDGFTGSLCEIKIENGGWSKWDNWGPCSVTCGKGFRTRYRTCSNPAPDNGGKQCGGNDWETSSCVMNSTCLTDCLADPPLENGDANCSWIDAARVCKPFCNEGFDFDSEMFLNAVICGRETGYNWNIETEDNQLGELPSCNEIKTATSNTMFYKGVYPDLDMDLVSDKTAATIQSRIDGKVEQAPCVRNGRCKHTKTEIEAIRKNEENRKKRETETVSFVVYVSCNPVADVEDCFNLLKEVKEMLDSFIQQLAFSVDVASRAYNVDFDSISIDGITTCEPGSVPVFYYCVPCGKGMYQLEDYCEMCPRGTYQDEIGQTTCKDCPKSWSTAGLMTKNYSLCNVPVDVQSASLTVWTVVIAVVSPAVTICICVILCIAVFRWYHHRQRKHGKEDFSCSLQANSNKRFDKSRLFMIDNSPGVYPPIRSPPPDYSRPPSAPSRNNFMEKK